MNARRLDLSIQLDGPTLFAPVPAILATTKKGDEVTTLDQLKKMSKDHENAIVIFKTDSNDDHVFCYRSSNEEIYCLLNIDKQSIKQLNFPEIGAGQLINLLDLPKNILEQISKKYSDVSNYVPLQDQIASLTKLNNVKITDKLNDINKKIDENKYDFTISYDNCCSAETACGRVMRPLGVRFLVASLLTALTSCLTGTIGGCMVACSHDDCSDPTPMKDNCCLCDDMGRASDDPHYSYSKCCECVNGHCSCWGRAKNDPFTQPPSCSPGGSCNSSKPSYYVHRYEYSETCCDITESTACGVDVLACLPVVGPVFKNCKISNGLQFEKEVLEQRLQKVNDMKSQGEWKPNSSTHVMLKSLSSSSKAQPPIALSELTSSLEMKKVEQPASPIVLTSEKIDEHVEENPASLEVIQLTSPITLSLSSFLQPKIDECVEKNSGSSPSISLG